MAAQIPDHTITLRFKNKKLECDKDSEDDCFKDQTVKWVDDGTVKNWVVFFSDGAPVNNKTPKKSNPFTIITGMARRGIGDERHVKYCIAATPTDPDGDMDDLDPELIVKPG